MYQPAQRVAYPSPCPSPHPHPHADAEAKRGKLAKANSLGEGTPLGFTVTDGNIVASTSIERDRSQVTCQLS